MYTHVTERLLPQTRREDAERPLHPKEAVKTAMFLGFLVVMAFLSAFGMLYVSGLSTY